MENVKIAYCIPGLHNPCGMERVLTMKANFLAAYGYEVHIIITDGSGKVPAFTLDTLIQVHQLEIDFEELYHYSFWRRVWLYQKRIQMFRKKLNTCLCQIKPDITISLLRRDINFINEMTDGSIKLGEIHFDRLHYRNFAAPSWMPPFLYSHIQRWWMKSLIAELRKLSKFIVLTEEDAAYWKELHNVVVLPNPTSFYPDVVSSCTNKQVIAAGRYVGQKGFDRLIPAWRKVVDKHPDWVLKIYGDGGMREQLNRQVEELELQNHCFLEHTIFDIVTKFQESSIFVLSSRFEGFGLVVVEAMSCGLPVVSFTCHCGPRDIISDGINGFLVGDGDVESLADKIVILIEQGELRQEMGREARQRAAHYKIEQIGGLWIKLFDSLILQTRK